jgi:hypothetical protein
MMLTVLLAIVLSLTTKKIQAADVMPNKTVEAQHFVLKNSSGTVMGEFKVGEDGKAVFELYDSAGEVTWSTNTRGSALAVTR